MKDSLKKSIGIIPIIFLIITARFDNAFPQNNISNNRENVREHLLMDFGWRFALGNSIDPKKNFDNGTGYFSYFTKTGYGDGAAAENFDDRAWRKIDLPHDWCVELPFDSLGSYSHGFKALGPGFPQNSVGWYRKKFFIAKSDLGKRISIEFEGVFRNSIVWVNGFYCGTEHSGYKSFCYDITDYLNYGANNVVAVRVDASMEEGWFYEGAGIYRNVWLNKTSPLHVKRYGTFITTDLKDNTAVITIRTNVINESSENSVFDISETVFNAEGNPLASGSKNKLKLSPGERKEYYSIYKINNPKLWSVERPYMHRLKTVIKLEGKITDSYETNFGIRTVKFDPDKGFFLNGKRVEIKGTNEHQDFAGVGIAVPYALQEFRVKKLKEMGSNAIRTSHNPPAPEFLDACDKLGMLVLDENRLMGSNKEHLDCLQNLIMRDRNHPSVILWSLGNEEWAIEGNIKGARIAATMQNFAQQFDSSRAFTAACSGGWDNGIGTVMQVMGYNYIVQGNIDEHHQKFPWQAGVGTEESNTRSTRGIYKTDRSIGYLAPTNRMPENVGTESGWKFYNQRPFLAGLFYWTGFDYRGEPNPFGWPQVTSQSGLLDLCGFPKDIFYYLKSWWSSIPVLHIYPHWNHSGNEREKFKTVIYSNCDQIELFLNNRSLGKKNMPLYGHLEWELNYEPGTLTAHGYKNSKEILEKEIKTTGNPAFIQLSADKHIIKANGEDVSVIKIQANDSIGLMVPTAENEIYFKLEGEGKILGVGNGNPSSHEADKFIKTIKTFKIEGLKKLPVDNLNNRPEVSYGYNDSEWKPAFQNQNEDWRVYTDTLIVVRGTFELPEISDETEVNLFTKSITEDQSIYVNGNLISANIKRDDPAQSFRLNHTLVHIGKNEYALTGKRFRKNNQWDTPNTDPGLVQVIYPAKQWKRKLFNGLAQILVQSNKQSGKITLTASSPELESASIKIQSQPEALKPEAD